MPGGGWTGEAPAGGCRPGSGTASGAGDLVQQPLAQQADRTAGGHATLAFIAGHAGDVQMGPALAFGEARQEAAGGNGTGPAAADVVDVGEAGIQHRLVLVPQRQAPGAVEDLLAGGQQF